MGYGYALADDIRHVELFGPELLVETAARYVCAYELAELRAFIAHKERTHRFRRGRWEPRPERARRAWELCGLDLPGVTLASGRASTRTAERRPSPGAAERGSGRWAGFHSIRYAAASALIEDGRSIVQVSKFLGHNDPAFTLKTYCHLMDDGLGRPLDIGDIGAAVA